MGLCSILLYGHSGKGNRAHKLASIQSYIRGKLGISFHSIPLHALVAYDSSSSTALEFLCSLFVLASHCPLESIINRIIRSLRLLRLLIVSYCAVRTARPHVNLKLKLL